MQAMYIKTDLPNSIRYVLSTLLSKGYTAHIVGGCVRDTLMGRTPSDYDVTTNALPEQIMGCFSGIGFILSGIRHGTVALKLNDEIIEVTTYRIDGEYKDNRHPESVIFTDRIEDDLARRDFTVNAMAISADGELCDPFNGINDIQQKIIRCVGDPDKRFEEDGLRILRALRFASVLSFNIENHTSSSICKNKSLLHNISSERIQSELFKLLTGDNAAQVLQKYRNVLCECFECSHAAYMERIDSLPKDVVLRLAALLYGTQSPKQSLQILKVSNSVYNDVMFILENCDSLTDMTDTDITKLFGIYGEHLFGKLICFSAFVTGMKDSRAERIAEKIIRENAPCKLKDLAITGEALLAIGLHGSNIGKCLSAMLTDVIEGKVANNTAELTAYAKVFAKQTDQN